MKNLEQRQEAIQDTFTIEQWKHRCDLLELGIDAALDALEKQNANCRRLESEAAEARAALERIRVATKKDIVARAVALRQEKIRIENEMCGLDDLLGKLTPYDR